MAGQGASGRGQRGGTGEHTTMRGTRGVRGHRREGACCLERELRHTAAGMRAMATMGSTSGTTSKTR